MSLAEKIKNQAYTKIADVAVNLVQTLLTKVLPLLGTWFLGQTVVEGQSGVIIEGAGIPPSLDRADRLSELTSDFFVVCFLLSLICATMLRLVVKSQRVALPLSESAALQRHFARIGLLGYLALLAYIAFLTHATDYSLLVAVIGGDAVGRGPGPAFLACFLLFTASIFLFAYSIFCYWLMPSSLAVLSQPAVIRWLPRMLSRFELKGMIGHG